ncbi:MAG: Tim44/TimA family putative adaptor protein [Hyphomicrobiales bacterium]|nr:Tim44/TimA family putative adaptor protein [Hyphomicrobiales bacterium]MBV9908685.1 Tim44/TimA family putative adaptor protein [Hyphomicrobiales bacterium]
MPEIDLPTVIFAIVALFVAWKLRSVLGMRQDSDRPGELMAPLRRAPGPASAPVAQPDAAPSAPVSQPPADRWKGVAEPNPGVWSGLDAIASADRSFSPEAFLSGAKVAYDMVVHAFAAGDSDALKSLMAPEAFANFESAIHARADAGHTMSTTVVSIDNATIASAALAGQTARVSVRFAAKLASVTRDAHGAVVDGAPNAVVDHIDLWTFARDIRSRDPNWQLTATESER